MTETRDANITEALEMIDSGLGQLLHRELISSDEVTDLLLDVRTLLTTPVDVADEQVPVPG